VAGPVETPLPLTDGSTDSDAATVVVAAPVVAEAPMAEAEAPLVETPMAEAPEEEAARTADDDATGAALEYVSCVGISSLLTELP
jgi:hypothetical protein